MRVLLVTPGFHGYHGAIAAALAERGHALSIHVYDDHGGLVGRTWYQLRHQLPQRTGAGSLRHLRRVETVRAVVAVEQSRPNAVVIVKGDTLEEPFWDLIDELRLPRVTWLYDEARRTRWDSTSLARVGPVATYSRLDDAAFSAAGIDSRWLPLAFDHRLVEPDERTRNDEVVFVGARYASRERILRMLAAEQVPVRAFGRDWSGHPVDRLRTWQWHRPAVPGGRDLSRDAAYREMAAGVATLNIHGDQDGLTMRTFEACGVGGLQLVDRTDLSDLYEPGVELLAWSGDDELIELCRRAASDQAWANGIRSAARRRTLAEHTFDHRVAVLESSWAPPEA